MELHNIGHVELRRGNLDARVTLCVGLESLGILVRRRDIESRQLT